MNKWDTCAGEAITSTIGLKTTDLDGNPIRYDSNAPLSNREGVIFAYDQTIADVAIEAWGKQKEDYASFI
jgi:3'-phosphoadenosine 5'-phosphosulfate (PAPS) 3'-phosphatase